MYSLRTIAFVTLVLAGCSAEREAALRPVKVEIVESGNGFQLLRGGKPYKVKGAGMVIDDIERFAAHGGNSIRNWTTNNQIQNLWELLDAAQANAVTVALCLPMEAERHGFDYDDADAVAAQLALFREEVLKFRDHPALLFWIIGNELNHSYTNPAVYDAVNDVAEMIHEIDPNHPTTTTVSGFNEDVIADIQERATALDFISFQVYGNLFGLPEKVADAAFDEPFMVTEWGTLGYWEMEQTSWGAPVELTSTEKAEKILEGYRDNLKAVEGQLIGSYVFMWGQKQERTATWFGLLTEDGRTTESVDVMYYIWNSVWPADRSPQVKSMLLGGKGARQNVVLITGESYEAELHAIDHENDPITYRWELKPESDADQSGGDYEKPIASLEGLLVTPMAASTMLTAPEPGKYRLFAYAYDDHGHAAHANIPFLVSEGNE